jgi:DNA-directed RNA polymerase subunit beta
MKSFVSSGLNRLRKAYSKIKSVAVVPDLIEMPKNSYDQFLQIATSSKNRKNYGLQRLLSSFFPIYSNDGRYILEFVDYKLGIRKDKENLEKSSSEIENLVSQFIEYEEYEKYGIGYDIYECKQRGLTYDVSLDVKFRLITNDINEDTGAVNVRDVKEYDVFLCDIPLMTKNASFIINGNERVIVSQIYRSPGIFFDSDKGKSNINGKKIYNFSIIPHRGSWLDVEFDSKDILYVRIDKRKKILATTLLRALDSLKVEQLRKTAAKENKVLDYSLVDGMNNEEILNTFYDKVSFKKIDGSWIIKFIPDFFKGRKFSYDLVDAKTKEVIVKSEVLINNGVIKKIQLKKVEEFIVNSDVMIDMYLASNFADNKNDYLKEISIGTKLSKIEVDIIDEIVDDVEFYLIDNINVGPYIVNTLMIDKNDTRKKALEEIYKVVRLVEATTDDVTEELFKSLFFDYSKYDLSEVGRYKINQKLGLDIEEDQKLLTKKDIIEAIKHLIKIKDNKADVDDIDNLANRRVRSIGELLEDELRVGLVRLEKSIKDKLSNLENPSPSELFGIKPLHSVIREFFGTSQLSQFMDQTNPLSEITHKRRLSSLGPKGLTRERASFEVRDVHLTHYGRICPIETPEGQNIGLISSMAIYARVNKYGFLETPYRKVENGKILDEVVYMTAMDEKDFVIAQANFNVDREQVLQDELISCRLNGEFVLLPKEEIHYMDISSRQLVSVAASLIPFLENDDANRALMGANMQRQAVPLLKPEAPFVGTGMEAVVVKDSGAAVITRRNGYVHYVDALRVVVRAVNELDEVVGVDIYTFKKFQNSNHNTCIHQIPIVKTGQYVVKGDIIADGHSTEQGELALGKNVLVAFMPWNGYNFEDSILISEKVVKEDVFTSVHIEEFEVLVRDTKLGPEEITSDIPNINEESIKYLDESGIVVIGAEVKTGDVLVGKVTPKAENVVTPEEKLLRAIFGEKASDVKDISLRVPSGVKGTVIGVRIYARRGIEEDSRTQLIKRKHLEIIEKDKQQEKNVLNFSYKIRLYDLLKEVKVVNSKKSKSFEIIEKDDFESLPISEIFDLKVDDKKIAVKIEEIKKDYDFDMNRLEKQFEEKIFHLQKNDEGLPAGVLKMVKVFVAVKRKLQSGDKMAGRHGNKGVVSRIVPVEDMPYLEDGTTIDMCLNPLGVPSRMNFGQVMEIHLGYACANISKKITQMLSLYSLKKIDISEIRNYLESIYSGDEISLLKKLDDIELINYANTLKKGIYVSTPVFDGAKEDDINRLLEFSGVDTSGQITLFDGKTGDMFERKITVGYMYMLKLHHLVDDKIHARSIGPYSLITQQPLGGKAQFGGQRFGEMDVWALEAYGAAYTLKEMLTVKSDDQIGRTSVYESIIKGDETFETGIPESFNVLVKELRSLCLDLDMKKTDK